MVAEGNVIFDQGAGPASHRAPRRDQLDSRAKESSGTRPASPIALRPATTSSSPPTRVEKTGPDTYELFNADVTACEDVVPKWSFTAKRAELKMGDRVKLYNSVFRVKSLPAFVLPYAWIPATRRSASRASCCRRTGTSNQKGRTLKIAYYQTLGESADITFRSDIYTQRGLGFGAEFRAQTDEKSYMRLGVFTVKDRLFGPPGENQGGTAFVGEGRAVPAARLARGRQCLARDEPRVSPGLLRRHQSGHRPSPRIAPSTRTTTRGNFSFNFLASNETTTLFRPSRDPLAPPASGTNFDIKIRQAPEIDITVYPRRIFESLPIYFSFDSSIGALKREETVDGSLRAGHARGRSAIRFSAEDHRAACDLAGIAITPSLACARLFTPAASTRRSSCSTRTSSRSRPTIRGFDPARSRVQSRASSCSTAKRSTRSSRKTVAPLRGACGRCPTARARKDYSERRRHAAVQARHRALFHLPPDQGYRRRVQRDHSIR